MTSSRTPYSAVVFLKCVLRARFEGHRLRPEQKGGSKIDEHLAVSRRLAPSGPASPRSQTVPNVGVVVDSPKSDSGKLADHNKKRTHRRLCHSDHDTIRLGVKITVSKENYLKAIAEAESEGERVIPATLANRLNVSAPRSPWPSSA